MLSWKKGKDGSSSREPVLAKENCSTDSVEHALFVFPPRDSRGIKQFFYLLVGVPTAVFLFKAHYAPSIYKIVLGDDYILYTDFI
jgi:hypothetical protein